MAKKRRTTEVNGWLSRHTIIRHALWIVCFVAALLILSHIMLTIGTRHGTRQSVPNLVGLHIDDAEYYASHCGLEVVINDSLYVRNVAGGTVLDQLPHKEVFVKKGRKIYVTINASAQRRMAVPYVAERSLRQAKSILESVGFTIKELVYTDDIATNYVLAQHYNGEQILPDSAAVMAEQGSGITLTVGVSADENVTAVPMLLGRHLFEAKSRLWEMGLNVGEVIFESDVTLQNQSDARVCEQSISQDSLVEFGTRVSMRLTQSAEAIERAVAAENERMEMLQLAKIAADSLREVQRLDSLNRLRQKVHTVGRSAAEQEFF